MYFFLACINHISGVTYMCKVMDTTYVQLWTKDEKFGLKQTIKNGWTFLQHCFQGIKYAHVRANRNSKTNNEMNLAGVLIVIVIVFLLCHFPR